MNGKTLVWFRPQLKALIDQAVEDGDPEQAEQVKQILSEALGHFEDEPVRFTLPLPPDLNNWLKEQAKLYDRSKTGHIVFLLNAIRATSEENQKRLNEVEVE